MICGSCGVGFLVNPGSKVHPVPVWFTSWADSGGTCGGEIHLRDRQTQIDKLDYQESAIARVKKARARRVKKGDRK